MPTSARSSLRRSAPPSPHPLSRSCARGRERVSRTRILSRSILLTFAEPEQTMYAGLVSLVDGFVRVVGLLDHPGLSRGAYRQVIAADQQHTMVVES